MSTSQQNHCYHCNTVTEDDSCLKQDLGGVSYNFCCSGCLAIALTIHSEGLDMFYARRSQVNSKPSIDLLNNAIPDRLLAYNDSSLSHRFLRSTDDTQLFETTLRLEKIRCAACVWLCEQHLLKQKGVKSIHINYVTQKAKVIFNPQITNLAQLIFEIERIGYEAWPYESSLSADNAKKERRNLLNRVGVAALGMMQVMMYAWPSYVKTGDLTPEFSLLLNWTSWLLTLPVILYSSKPIFQSAWHSVRFFANSRQLNMDVPIALALGLSFITGTISTILQNGPSYFDSLTMFVAFVLLARYFELLARQDALSGAEALAKQLPAICEKYINYSQDSKTKSIPVVQCQLDDVIRVSPGEIIPVDGTLINSSSAVDESLLSGESKPINKYVGDLVYAGSYNQQNPINIVVQAMGQSTRIGGIASLLDQALSTKPFLLSKSEKWAGYFVIFLILAALFSSGFWLFVDSSRAWTVLVAVLVASCPCALSLAIPTALTASQGTAAQMGLLIVRGHMMESLTKVSDLILDKTGTITLGKPKLIEIVNLRQDYSFETALAVASAMEDGQTHPLANAILEAQQYRNIKPIILSNPVINEIGKGLQSGHFRLGNSKFIGIEPVAKEGLYGQVHLADEEGLIASFIFLDESRPGVNDLLSQCSQKGITVHLISGDDTNTVKWWATQYKIDHYRGSFTPEDKYNYVQDLQNEGRFVLAIGDGINDAPLLASANVSIAVGSGAPLAKAGADGILTTYSLAPLAKIFKLADKTQSIIRLNLLWAFIYNVIAIPVAMMGWINPWIAGIGMSLSSLLVTLNAWRLRKV